MTSIQIKGVSPEAHAELRRRAAVAHQSLQEYLRMRLEDEAARPSLDDVLARAGGRADGALSFDDAVELLRSDRDRH